MSTDLLTRTVPFESALVDRTRGHRKVLRRDYLDKGSLPVVDQGTDLIGGFTNEEGLAYRGSLPVIIFGDHTRLIKYVDFRFALGADGVKALEPTRLFEPRYLYYYLMTKQIRSRGYARHFQSLRRLNFRWIPLAEQRRVIEIVSHADRLRRLGAEAEQKVDRVLPALLASNLGDPTRWADDCRSRYLGDLADVVSGATPSKGISSYWDGTVPWISPKDMKQDFIDDGHDHVSHHAVDQSNLKVVEPGSVLIVVRGMILARAVPVALALNPLTINQDMKALVPKYESVSGRFLWAALKMAKTPLRAMVRTAAHGTRKLDTPDLMRLPVIIPEEATMAQIEEAVKQHQRLLIQRTRRAAMIQDVFSALLKGAFNGSLTASWREAHLNELVSEMEQQSKALGVVADV